MRAGGGDGGVGGGHDTVSNVNGILENKPAHWRTRECLGERRE